MINSFWANCGLSCAQNLEECFWSKSLSSKCWFWKYLAQFWVVHQNQEFRGYAPGVWNHKEWIKDKNHCCSIGLSHLHLGGIFQPFTNVLNKGSKSTGLSQPFQTDGFTLKSQPWNSPGKIQWTPTPYECPLEFQGPGFILRLRESQIESRRSSIGPLGQI